jgi:hypothetical protein
MAGQPAWLYYLTGWMDTGGGQTSYIHGSEMQASQVHTTERVTQYKYCTNNSSGAGDKATSIIVYYNTSDSHYDNY